VEVFVLIDFNYVVTCFSVNCRIYFPRFWEELLSFKSRLGKVDLAYWLIRENKFPRKKLIFWETLKNRQIVRIYFFNIYFKSASLFLYCSYLKFSLKLLLACSYFLPNLRLIKIILIKKSVYVYIYIYIFFLFIHLKWIFRYRAVTCFHWIPLNSFCHLPNAKLL